jgi:hypothetical protein
LYPQNLREVFDHELFENANTATSEELADMAKQIWKDRDRSPSYQPPYPPS